MTEFEEVLETILEEYARRDTEGDFDTWEETDSFVKEKAEVLLAYANLKEEPVSMWHDASEEPKPNMELICVGQYGNPLVLSSNSNSFKERYISKWAYFNDLLNFSNLERTVKNWKEPGSEELEKAAELYTLDDSIKPWRNLTKEAFKAGANWQRQKDEHLIWQTSTANYEKGIEEGKQQMMKDAVEAEVEGISKSILNGSWGYFKVEGSYKNGDKVRMIIIKDE